MYRIPVFVNPRERDARDCLSWEKIASPSAVLSTPFSPPHLLRRPANDLVATTPGRVIVIPILSRLESVSQVRLLAFLDLALPRPSHSRHRAAIATASSSLSSYLILAFSAVSCLPLASSLRPADPSHSPSIDVDTPRGRGSSCMVESQQTCRRTRFLAVLLLVQELLGMPRASEGSASCTKSH